MHQRKTMNPRITRYFYPSGGFIGTLWNSYDGLEDLTKFFVDFQQQQDCYTFHIGIDGLSALFPVKPREDELFIDTSIFNKKFKLTTYLGVPMRRHRVLKMTGRNEDALRPVFENLEPHLNWLLALVKNVTELGTEEYSCQLQFLVKHNQLVPIIAVYDSVDIDMLPLFDPPSLGDWLEIPIGVFDSVIYTRARCDVVDQLYSQTKRKEFTTDWAVLEALKPMIDKYNSESKSWPKHKVQSYENQIHTLIDMAKQNGLKIDSILRKSGVKL